MDNQNNFEEKNNQANFPLKQGGANPQQISSSDKVKAPILVRILAILMLLGGLLSLVAIIYLFFANWPAAEVGLSSIPTLTLMAVLLWDIAIIIAAFGLRSMKKWGLYFVVSWIIFSVVSILFSMLFQHSIALISGAIDIIISGLIAAYLIIIRNKFDPEKSHQPILIVTMAFVALLLSIGAYFAFGSYEKFRTQNIQEISRSAKTLFMSAEVTDADIAKLFSLAVAYHTTNNTFAGFTIPANSTPLSACNNKPIINISADGRKLAIFTQYCDSAKQGKYKCMDSEANSSEVDEAYAQSSESSCQTLAADSSTPNGSANNQAVGLGAPITQNEADNETIESSISQGITDANRYLAKNNSYLGFQGEAKIPMPNCAGENPMIKISADGKKIAIYGKLCFQQNTYFCADSEGNPNEVSTDYVAKGNPFCKPLGG